MPASTEFADLCQSQITMMARAVDAESTAVYLAESWTEQALPQLVPIAVYPPVNSTTQPRPGSLAADKALPGNTFEPLGKDTRSRPQPPAALTPDETEEVLNPQQRLLSYGNAPQSEQAVLQQLAIPLTHEGQVVGILVSRRANRPWQKAERDQMEECAHSLALACVLDQRGQWLQTQLSALNQLQTQQSDRFHELLHQLRNPLTALKTFGKLMVKRLSPEDKNQSLALSMLRESDRMRDLLGYFDDTLEAADQTRTTTSSSPLLLPPSEHNDTTVEAKALPVTAESLSHFGGPLTIQPCAVKALVAPLAGSMEALSETFNITLHVLSPESDSLVNADAQALTEVISILLENALKYAPSRSDIWLQWGLSHPHELSLEGILIGDTGPGIPKADQPHIFERHYRGIQASGQIEGTGLGLAIACDLMQKMAGAIEVHSPLGNLPMPLRPPLPDLPEERGTAFIVWLLKG
ncbi:MAG: ATP-binding protein [Cyanobacteria bacterium J06636_16]